MTRRLAVLLLPLFVSLLLAGCSATPAVTSLSIIPNVATVTTGATVQFKATATYHKSNGTTYTNDVSSQVTWSSSNTSVLTIDSTGMAKAVSAGSGNVVAALKNGDQNATTSAAVTVNAPTVPPPPPVHELLSISITPSNQTLTANGQLGQFIAIGNFTTAPTTQDLTNQVSWQSSAPGVATIGLHTGIATGVGPGSSTITATGVSATGATIVGTATLTNNATPPPAARDLVSVAIVPSSQTLTSALQKAQFTAVGTYTSAPSPAVITTGVQWGSSVADVATIDSTGLATAQGRAGTSAITATATTLNGTRLIGTATLTESASTVQKRELLSISIIPASQPITNPGDTAQFIAVGTYSAAPALDLIPNNQITWASSVVQYATINSTGLATAVGIGTSFITATYQSASGATLVGQATISVGTGGPSQLPTLTVIKLGAGGPTALITSNPGTINCGTTCSATFPLNSTVKLFANTAPASWSGNCVNPSFIAGNGATSDDGLECDVLMSTNTVVAAVFN